MDMRLRQHSSLVGPGLQCQQLAALSRSLQLYARAARLHVFLVDYVAAETSQRKLATGAGRRDRGRLGSL